MPKPQPSSKQVEEAQPPLQARPRPEVDPVAAAKKVAARYPIVMARLAE